MFCKKCGNPIPDGSAFCTACGQAVAATEQQPETVQAPQQTYYQPASTLSYEGHFRQTWRTFACGTLALVLLLLQTASIILTLVDVNSLTSSLSGIFGMLGEEAVIALSAIQSTITGATFVAMIPGILMLIGMWMLYMDARDKSDRPIKTSGLKLIRGVQIASAVLSGIGILLVFMGLQTVTQVVSSAGAYYGGLDFGEQAMIDSIMSTFYGIIVVVVAIAVFAYIMIFRTINAVIKSLEGSYPATNGLTFFAVIYFISGGFAVISLMGPAFTISSAVSCASTIVLAVLLIKYKSMMNQLQADRTKFNTTPTYQ